MKNISFNYYYLLFMIIPLVLASPFCNEKNCPPIPPYTECCLCNPSYISWFSISSLVTNQTVTLMTNNEKKIICLKNLTFSYDCTSTFNNQGSIFLNVYFESDGPSRSLHSRISSLKDPFSCMDTIFKCNTMSTGCQLRSNDKLLLQIILFNSPYIDTEDGSLYVLSSVSTK